MSWTRDARTISIFRVAQQLQIETGRGANLAWCPACQSRGHGSARTFRSSDGTDRWHCHRCDTGGDVIDLAAVALTGDRLPRGHSQASATVRAWFASRGWCEAAEGETVEVQHVPKAPPPEKRTRQSKPPPPQDQVLALLRSCRPVLGDLQVRAWLQRRLSDRGTEVINGRGLVGALPAGTTLPAWARFQRQRWDRLGYRAILPLYDHEGQIRSVRARRVIDGDGPKALPPMGFGYRGLILANRLGRHLLEHGARPSELKGPQRRNVTITEGEHDFLAWAAEALLPVPRRGRWPGAVFSILSGSWTDEIASRIPIGSRVLVATDHDRKGHQYATKIHDSLPECTVRRWTPQSLERSA